MLEQTPFHLRWHRQFEYFSMQRVNRIASHWYKGLNIGQERENFYEGICAKK